MRQYWVKGDDGEEYGPIRIEEVREWIGENRVGRGTLIRLEAPDAQWTPAEKMPELVDYIVESEVARLGLGPSGLPLAGFIPRALAFLWDSVVVSVFVLLVIELFNWLLPEMGQVDLQTVVNVLRENGAPTPLSWLIWTVTLGVQISYFTYYHGRYGQTPGKRLLRIRVVDGLGITPGYKRAFLRAIGSLVSQMPMFMGYLFFFLSPARRTFHDLLTGTLVVREFEKTD
jgi:uncharacterized RDD family membrane protein YckC